LTCPTKLNAVKTGENGVSPGLGTVKLLLCLIEDKRNMGTEDLGSEQSLTLLQNQLDRQSFSSLIVPSPGLTSHHMQNFPTLTSLEKTCNAHRYVRLRLTVHSPAKSALEQHSEVLNRPIPPARFPLSRLTTAHFFGNTEIGQSERANCLLTPRDMNNIVVEVNWTELSTVTDLSEENNHNQNNNVFALNRYTFGSSVISQQQADSQQMNVESLRRTLSEVRHQFNAQLKQRDIEKKLLMRALAVAKTHLKGEKHVTHTPTTIHQKRNTTLSEHLRKEIAAIHLPFDKTKENQHNSQLQSQQMQSDFERAQDELTKQLEQSESSRKQLEEINNRLSEERLELESSLNDLRNKLSGDKSIEQMQINTLQQSLDEIQQALDQSKAAHQEREQELLASLDEKTRSAEQYAQTLGNENEQLQQALETSRTELARAQAKQQQWELDLQEAFAEADRTIDENQARTKTQIDTLQQQIQNHESLHQQLLQEKTRLTNGLQTESQRALDFMKQAQSLDEDKNNLEKKLETLQRAYNEAKTQHQHDTALLTEELDQARQAIDKLSQSRQQLDEALQQAETESQAHQERERGLQEALDESRNKAKRTEEELHRELKQLRQNQAHLQQTLEESRTQLTQTNAEHERRISSLQSALEDAERSADEGLASSAAKIATLQYRIQTQDSSLQKLAQEKAELASCLQSESSHTKELEQRANSIEELRRGLEHELERTRNAFDKASVHHQKEMTLLKEELKQARQTIDELEQSRQLLDATLQQMQSEFLTEQEQLKQSLETEIQQAGEEKSRLSKLVGHYKRQAESIRIKAIRQRNKRRKLEATLAEEQNRYEQLNHLIKTTEKRAEIANNRCTEAERSQQELMAELEKEIKAAQEALEKSSEAEVALQMAKLNHATIIGEREQEIDKLTAQLEHQEESRKAILNQHSEEKAQLQQSLNETKASLMVAENTIGTLKRDRQLIRETKSEADQQLTQLKAESQKKEAEFIAALESSHQEAASLRQELADTKRLITNPEEVEHLHQTLHQAVEEKAALQREVARLQKVQTEKRQPDEIRDTENTKLRWALFAVEKNRKRAEMLTQRTATLKREREVQEVAVEMLSADLDALTKEKAMLVDERDRLLKELSDIRTQRKVDTTQNNSED
jgi:chromosome segregation ATPase